ncbi:DUF4468 domain-containing protein [Aeromonas caviae]|jgi:hypothetical protein|uniref:DUF4468 domain-containing protein n=1 Tax=Aeromonas caviae TaxID=648 RepID=A0ABU5WCH4_AERCA|nr:DUF4468 domain-containing protein [Aeromonas caviae]MEA9438560.1 DUF4468 domain-containing protein [Aeromonas caviae]
MKKNDLMGACFILCFGAFIGGCATGPELTQISSSDIKPVTFDYNIPNASKNVLFTRARDHFATVYGDSRSVIRVQDENDGVIIGKGAIEWKVPVGLVSLSCHSEYNIRFMAKDAKARLQMELIVGAPTYSQCTGWDRPTITAYKEVLTSFDNTSKNLDAALNGLGDGNSFKDF